MVIVGNSQILNLNNLYNEVKKDHIKIKHLRKEIAAQRKEILTSKLHPEQQRVLDEKIKQLGEVVYHLNNRIQLLHSIQIDNDSESSKTVHLIQKIAKICHLGQKESLKVIEDERKSFKKPLLGFIDKFLYPDRPFKPRDYDRLSALAYDLKSRKEALSASKISQRKAEELELKLGKALLTARGFKPGDFRLYGGGLHDLFIQLKEDEKNGFASINILARLAEMRYLYSNPPQITPRSRLEVNRWIKKLEAAEAAQQGLAESALRAKIAAHENWIDPTKALRLVKENNGRMKKLALEMTVLHNKHNALGGRRETPSIKAKMIALRSELANKVEEYKKYAELDERYYIVIGAAMDNPDEIYSDSLEYPILMKAWHQVNKGRPIVAEDFERRKRELGFSPS